MKTSIFYKGKHVRLSSPGQRALSLLCVILLAVFLFSAGMAGRIISLGIQEQRAFDHLAAAKQALAGSTPAADKTRAEGDACALLQEQNPDFAAWLRVDGTGIDYPVMYTPEDPEYYLRRAFDGAASISGTPFIGAGGDVESGLFIIYGHNMKNGTMFGTLDRYQQAAFWQEHSTLTLALPGEKRVYEIFAAVQTRILNRDEAGLRYYQLAGNLSMDEFDALAGWLADNALYHTGAFPSYGTQILILSTCSYHTENGRFIVAAQRIS